MITNIIDDRTRRFRWLKINAVIEPTWHDNVCDDADRAERNDSWVGYEEKEHVSLTDAVAWATAHPDDVTLYLFDADGGIYVTARADK